MTKRSIILLYAVTVILVVVTVATIEFGMRYSKNAEELPVQFNVTELQIQLPHARISGREIGNQMLVHNVALFAAYPTPAKVDTAYVGTSRTKVLRPGWMGQTNAINASGNSYNEISYGLLLQAEVARLQFPGLKRVYFESSLLLRRPARLIVEPDHVKYLPLLESLLPLRNQLPGAKHFRAELIDAKVAQQAKPFWRLDVLKHRDGLRLHKLIFPAGTDQDKSIPVRSDRLFKELDPSGQRHALPPSAIPSAEQRPEITAENVKVQRLRDVPSWSPWDSLFDMVVLWGRMHNIEVVLFQPPVRSDLYRYQLQMGLFEHVNDLERIVRQYGVPFIDLNRPELRYMDDWTLFSDEDHMETCAGVVLLQSALDMGYQLYKRDGELLPKLKRADVQKHASAELAGCSAGNPMRVLSAKTRDVRALSTNRDH